MRNALRTLRLHRAAWQLLGGPLAWWFLPAALVTLVLSALGWWGIGALAEHLADRWLPEEEWRHAPGWLAALVEVTGLDGALLPAQPLNGLVAGSRI